jgi:hypothetical protein
MVMMLLLALAKALLLLALAKALTTWYSSFKECKNAFSLNNKKLRQDVTTFFQCESLFIYLKKKDLEMAGPLCWTVDHDMHHRMDHLLELSAGFKPFGSPDEVPLLTVFAFDTGRAARVAATVVDVCTLSGVCVVLTLIIGERVMGDFNCKNMLKFTTNIPVKAPFCGGV